MHDAMGIRNVGVHGAVDGQPCRIDGVLTVAEDFAGQVDLHQVRCGDFIVSKSERVDEELIVGTRHAQRDVVEDQFMPAQHEEHAIGRGQFDACSPFGVGANNRTGCSGFHNGHIQLQVSFIEFQADKEF